MRTILLTGGTGLVGTALVKHLHAKNYNVIILTRSLKGKIANEKTGYALWDVEKGTIDREAVQKADAIINLAGAGVMDKKWTTAYKQEIVESRTKSSDLLVTAMKTMTRPPKVLVSASAIGWYGADKQTGHFFTEDEPADSSFLGEVCRLWEESTMPAEALGVRVCRLRIGIVLAKTGGAYPSFRKPLALGVASILGSGDQAVSWIHIDDLCRAFIYALENEKMLGSYNAAAPAPVSNKKLTLTIAHAVTGKFFLPVHVPGFILKTILGGRSIEVLKSTAVSAQKIEDAGFTFLYPDIESAVNAVEHS